MDWLESKRRTHEPLDWLNDRCFYRCAAVGRRGGRYPANEHVECSRQYFLGSDEREHFGCPELPLELVGG